MYHILNWNTGLTEDDQFLEEILQYIKGFLDQDNAIAVLQQIPYKDYENKWNLHAIYMRILEVFPEIEYSIIKNDNFNNGYIIMMTVIITKLKTWDYCDDVVYSHAIASNREVAIKLHDKYSLLGLHAKNGQENLSYIKSISNHADIIVGDFNAGDYDQYPYWKIFRNILESHVCICNMPTKVILSSTGELLRKSCIDHVFVRRELVSKCSCMKVHEDITFSDHYPITFGIGL